MPYIKQEGRPPYNAIVRELIPALKNNDRRMQTSLRLALVSHVERLNLFFVDGDMNYFMTKLLKELKWHKSSASYFGTIGSPVYTRLEHFLLDALLKIYQPKYFNYNRLEGLLLCCNKEFKRRYGKSAIVIDILFSTMMAKIYEDVVGPYEDEAIGRNGDV